MSLAQPTLDDVWKLFYENDKDCESIAKSELQ